jgi:hypothetical protein
MKPIRLTSEGEKHIPRVAHHFAAWGGIKELLRVKSLKGEVATRDEILEVLSYCGHHNDANDPNEHYLGYALKNGWLAED